MSPADVAAAFMLCQSYFTTGYAICDWHCQYQWTDPRCEQVEKLYYSPGMPGNPTDDQTKAKLEEARKTLEELLAR